MENQTIFAVLRNVLAELYPEEQDARVVAFDAQLDTKQITFSPRAQTNWHNILVESIRQNHLDALLEVVRAAYGNNQAFIATSDMYHRFIAQGSHIEPPVQLPVADSPTQLIETSGGAAVASNVNTGTGDFIGRDQNVQGDKVMGNKIIYQALPASCKPLEYLPRVEHFQDRKAEVDKRALREAMISAFNVEDLELLCADVQQLLADDGIELQIDLDTVGGNSKPTRVLNLIAFMDRRRYLSYLVAAVRQQRPGLVF